MTMIHRIVCGAALLGTMPLAAQAPVESEFTFATAGLVLQGTLTLPAGDGPWPGVVIVAGSGPTDRNGNSAAGLATDMYRLLAHGLAELGIASLRYDKRGLPSSEGTFDMAATTIEDFARDALAATRALDARDDISGVFLLGHSEGGTLATLAVRDGAPVRGLILVATLGRRFRDVVREQLARQLPEGMLAQFDTAWAGYLDSDTAVTYPPALAGLFVPVNRRFTQSWDRVNMPGLVAGIEQPVLVVQGETDVQATVADGRALAAADPTATLEILPGVNHVLKETTGATAVEQMPTYTNPAIPLAPGVVSLIAGWIGAHASS